MELKNMIKKVGRLDRDDFQLLDSYVEKISKNLDKGNINQAQKLIYEVANTPNYFVREELGKRLAEYTGTGNLDAICYEMLEDRFYPIRATALFYFYYKNQDKPELIVQTLEKTFETVPWESETICSEMWKKYPDVMKEYMPRWADSDNPKKRAMSMHGMEYIAAKNPQYVLTFVGRLLDDEDEEVQKKVSHILIQVGRQRPLQTFASIRRWLLDGDEKRANFLWQILRRLSSIFSQKNMRDKSQDFFSIALRTAQEWKTDSNPAVVQMGNKLAKMIKNQ
jgi:3-methyladenine DNA glycosylase AlkC